MNWQNLSGEEQKQIFRQRGLTDLYFFDKVILEYKEMGPNLHLELCNFISKWDKKKKLILMPRGSFKSSCITIGLSLQEIVKDPNIRILIDSETLSTSKRFLYEIKGHIEHNELFRGVYGCLDSRREEDKYTESEIIISTRTTNPKEPTISTAGLDVVKVGMHYDLIIVDDPVSQNNITSKELIDKVIDHYKLILSILEPDGRLIIIGTRWHYSDLYGYLIDNEKDSFDILIKKAIQSDGTLLFPSRLTEDFLNSQKKSQGSYIFSCQYQNEPVDDESAVFKKSWIKYYTEQPEGTNITTTIDPAISKRETADYSAIVTVGTDYKGDIYVLETLRGRWETHELLEKIFEVNKRWQPWRIGIESVAFQKTLKDFLEYKAMQQNIYIPMFEIKPETTRSKEMRIRGLQPRFEAGKIFLKKGMDDLIDELLRVPVGQHDDLVDALSMQLAEGFRITGEKPEEEEKESTEIEKFWEQVKKQTLEGVERHPMFDWETISDE